jgi:hypothetical protein
VFTEPRAEREIADLATAKLEVEEMVRRRLTPAGR